MERSKSVRKIPWLPILLLAWNILDAAVHIAGDRAEPLRIAGNIVAIAAAVIVLLGFAQAMSPRILSLSAIAILALNTAHSAEHGFGPPMLVFIGLSVFLLLRWAQVQSAQANAESDQAAGSFALRWWLSLAICLGGVALVAISGLPVN